MTLIIRSHDCHMISDRRERPDPTKAPDPEDPSEDFSEESVTTLVEGKFQPPADNTTVTLDNCETIYLYLPTQTFYTEYLELKMCVDTS